ncbi:sensor histidine kinase [Terrarubrum flagellatum]|uniref:sensor histidine kinase n=1 Tax=Terrirubrum flagellatum TaxID=2895980 RepID=UPI0031455BB0
MQLRDWRLSLRVRIIASLSAVLAAGAVALGVAAWRSASVAAQQAYDRLLSGGAIQIAENVYVQGEVVALEPPVAAIATLSAYDLVFYKVVDPRGVVVAGYDDLASRAAPAAAQSGVVLEDGDYQGQSVRIATVARRLNDPGPGGWATIVVAQTIDARKALARDLTLNALGVIGGMSLLALVAVGLSVRLALKPLMRIEHEIANRRPDDLRPIETEPPVEVRNLVHAIDDFMRRLADRMSVMQRFIADAAHQIRTPLAALGAQVEMLSSAKPSKGKAEHITRIRERTAELSRLASQLLDHAMVIHRADAASFAPVDLNELAKTVLARAVPLSLAREVDVSFTPASSSLTVDGDAVALREALSNLIDNALAHGARSKLSVTVGADETAAWVEIGDDGDGFAIEDQSKLIRPFEKGGASHGSGLGLSIASEVARAHGGELVFTRRDSLFRVTLRLGREA